MWKVTNNINKKILEKFNKLIINQFFLILINLAYKIEKGIISNTSLNIDLWKKSKYYNYSNSKLLDYIFNIQYKKTPLKEVVNEVLKTQKLDSIVKYYKLYKEQNNNIDNFIYSIDVIKIDSNISIIFRKYFYEVMFNDEYIWKTIHGKVYNRDIFHKNFVKENNYIQVCPYCDLDTFLANANKNVEHMLPKSKFPFLAMNGNNLLSSCHACNSPSEGKGVLAKTPIIFPYNTEVGEYLNFKIKQHDKKIEINVNDNKATDIQLRNKLNNYLELLKLKKRYEKTDEVTPKS